MNKTNNKDLLSSLIMLLFLGVAMILANTTSWYGALTTMEVSIPWIGKLKSLKSFSKDVLMVPFFIYVGMELRWESVKGSLSSKRKAMLPLCAAIGGVVFPAIIYLAVNFNYPENYRGFGIPCATDIAFAICLFNLIGKKLVPSSKAFLLAIAIFDDLIAILIIALFYTNDLNWNWILLSAIPISILLILYIKSVCSIAISAGILIALYICFSKGGINTTLSGFLVGFLFSYNTKEGHPHLEPIMKKLEPLVKFIILPIFVFAVAGISFEGFKVESFYQPIVLGIIIGLFLGKQIGITLFTYIALKIKLVALPDNCKVQDVYIISCIAGIGFTMSLFIGMLAFNDAYIQNLVKVGVVFGSSLCAFFSVTAVLIYRRFSQNNY